MSTPNPVDPHRKSKREREEDEQRRHEAPGQQPGQPRREIDPPRGDEDETEDKDDTEEEWSRTPRLGDDRGAM